MTTRVNTIPSDNVDSSEKVTQPPIFVTKLNEVMKLSYMDTKLFRTSSGQAVNLQYSLSTVLGDEDRTRSGRDQSRKHPVKVQRNDLVSQESYVNNNIDRFKTSFNEFVPRLNDVMNLSYMNSQTFRNGRENNNQNSRRKLVLKRRRRPSQKLPNTVTTDTRRTIKSVTGRRQETDRSSAQNEIVNNQNVLNRQPSTRLNSRMKWMWPPNSMDFHNFNFNAFDSQFSEDSKVPRSSILMPSIVPKYSSFASHVFTDARYSNSPAYSLSINL